MRCYNLRLEIRNTYLEICTPINPNVMISLEFRNADQYRRREEMVKSFYEKLDICLFDPLGSSESEYPSGIFFFESGAKGYYALGLFHLPTSDEDFSSVVSDVWSGISRNAKASVQKIVFPSGLLFFCTKSIVDSSYNFDGIYLCNYEVNDS